MRAVCLLLLTLCVGGCSVPDDPWEERIRGREPPAPGEPRFDPDRGVIDDC